MTDRGRRREFVGVAANSIAENQLHILFILPSFCGDRKRKAARRDGFRRAHSRSAARWNCWSYRLVVRLDAGLLDDPGPLLRLARESGDELRERARRHLRSDLVESLAEFRLGETLRDLAPQTLDDRRRRSGRRHQGIPGGGI